MINFTVFLRTKKLRMDADEEDVEQKKKKKMHILMYILMASNQSREIQREQIMSAKVWRPYYVTNNKS